MILHVQECIASSLLPELKYLDYAKVLDMQSKDKNYSHYTKMYRIMLTSKVETFVPTTAVVFGYSTMTVSCVTARLVTITVAVSSK